MQRATGGSEIPRVPLPLCYAYAIKNYASKVASCLRSVPAPRHFGTVRNAWHERPRPQRNPESGAGTKESQPCTNPRGPRAHGWRRHCFSVSPPRGMFRCRCQKRGGYIKSKYGAPAAALERQRPSSLLSGRVAASPLSGQRTAAVLAGSASRPSAQRHSPRAFHSQGLARRCPRRGT